MSTKVKVTASWGKKETKSSIKIKAKTLGDALTALQKRDEWGKFEGQLDYAYKTDSDDHVTEVTLKPSYTIQMPTWDGYKKAPKACQKEWDRMWKKLEQHEDKHRLIHLEMYAKVTDYLSKATDLTVKKFEADFKKMAQEGQANQDKFDSSSKHGQRDGVNLTITDECK